MVITVTEPAKEATSNVLFQGLYLVQDCRYISIMVSVIHIIVF